MHRHRLGSAEIVRRRRLSRLCWEAVRRTDRQTDRQTGVEERKYDPWAPNYARRNGSISGQVVRVVKDASRLVSQSVSRCILEPIVMRILCLSRHHLSMSADLSPSSRVAAIESKLLQTHSRRNYAFTVSTCTWFSLRGYCNILQGMQRPLPASGAKFEDSLNSTLR